MSIVTHYKPKWQRKVARWKKRLDDFKEDCQKLKDEDKHKVGLMKDLLVDSRGGDYSVYGYFVTAKKPKRRKVYTLSVRTLMKRLKDADIRPVGYKKSDEISPAVRAAQAAKYVFEYKPPPDGQNWLSSYKPYRYQAHHLIPDEAVSEDIFGGAEPWAVMKKIPYDINHGENIMLLPATDKYTSIHQLPKHNGSHPDYNDMVIGRMSRFKKDLKKTDCDSKNPPPMSVLTDMISFQDTCFNFLKRKGKAGAATVQAAAKRARLSFT
jgi:hypothetical protein